ncbi:hypothetical protein RA28_09735 [Ruegeria sp. ANG-S4]|nr:hypothetical protein RA28_09735 [Ruegeria sp. ANG-S4]
MPPMEKQDISDVIREAFEHGIRIFDVSGDKNPSDCERLIKQELQGVKDALVSTKWRLPVSLELTGNATSDLKAIAERSLTMSLRNLNGIQVQTLYVQPHSNPTIMDLLVELFEKAKKSGHVLELGLLNASPEKLSSKQKEYSIDVVKMEISLLRFFNRQKYVLEIIDRGGRVHAANPLGRGVLARTPSSKHQVNDRSMLRKLMTELNEISKKHRVSPSRIALCWLHYLHRGIVPVLGTTNPSHLRQNLQRSRLTLSNEEFTRLMNLAAARSAAEAQGVLSE